MSILDDTMEVRLEKPTICILCGIAGSGKTFMGKHLAKLLNNGVFLSKDLVQDAFTEVERSGELYEKISLPTFKLLLSFADIQLSHGKIPIIDCPFSYNHNRNDERKNWVEQFERIAEKHNARLAVVRCVPPNEDELKRRLTKRGNQWDLWKLQNWEAFLERDPVKFPILHNDVHEVVTKELEESTNSILSYLEANPHKPSSTY